MNKIIIQKKTSSQIASEYEVNVKGENIMMKTVCLQDWILKIDVEKTKKYYNSIIVEEGCDCDYCRNYIENCKIFRKKCWPFIQC